MQRSWIAHLWRWGSLLLLLQAGTTLSVRGAAEGLPMSVLTKVAGVQRSSSPQPLPGQPVRLQGLVCWADAARGLLILQDDSGAALIEMDSLKEGLRAGQAIILTGTYTPGCGRASLKIGTLALPQGGAAELVAQHGTTYLSRGPNPITVAWQGGNNLESLGVFYDSTNLQRRLIPDSALLRPVALPTNGVSNWVQGVEYQVYEGPRTQRADFEGLTPVRSGVAANFDFRVRTRDRFGGVKFSGYLEAVNDAYYTFYLVARGRAQLCLEGARLEVLDVPGVPAPRQIVCGEVCAGPEPPRWTEVEGRVTYIGTGASPWLELSRGNKSMEVEIGEALQGSPVLLLNGRVRVTGLCRSSYSQEGQVEWGKIWVPSLAQVELLEVAPELWSSSAAAGVGRVQAGMGERGGAGLTRVRGKVRSLGAGRSMVVEDETGRLPVSAAMPAAQ